jgi:3-oxoadipate enol-lactonase
MPYSVRNGLRTYYEVAGEGPPLVLVHANPFDHRLWAYQVARFSPFYKTIAVDLRGYGRTDKPETAFTLEDLTNDVVGVCEDEKVERAIFVGCSVGSGIALYLGLHRPEMVDALVLVGGSSRGPKDVSGITNGLMTNDLGKYLMHLMRGYVAPGWADTPLGSWWLNLFVANASNQSAKCIAQVFRARGTYDMSGLVKNIKAPTLVVNGQYDVSAEAGKETASLIPQAEHYVLPNTGHACNIEDPERFDSRVTEFLKNNKLWAGA